MAPLVRRSWASRGHTPVLTQRGRSRRKVSVIGALVISPQRRRVRAYFGFLPAANYDGASILAFLRQLRRSVRSPIELLWDRLLAHRGEPIASSQVRHRARVRIQLLPPYAPEAQSGGADLGSREGQRPGELRPYELPQLLDQTQVALLAVRSFMPTAPFFTPEIGHYLYRAH